MSDYAADQMLARYYDEQEENLKAENSFSTFQIQFSDGTDLTCFTLQEAINEQVKALAQNLLFTVIQSPSNPGQAVDKRAVKF